MAFEIRLGHCFKRFNSTLQPDTSTWYTTEALWKNAKDIDTPSWHIHAPGVSALLDWNYAYMPDRQAYYWITSIVSLGNERWEISAAMDVLATYKTAIMGTPGMIEYGFNADASGAVYRLQDTRQNVSNVPIIATATADIMGGNISPKYGTYVLTAVGSSGGVTAYALTYNQIRNLLNSINQDITDAIADFQTMEEILKFFTANSLAQGSAIQAVRGCTWIPLRITIFGTDIQDIYLGDFKTGIKGKQLSSNPVYTVETDIAIPWQATDWRRLNSQILMYVPFIGTVAVPVNQCNAADKVHFTVAAELITGGLSVRVDAGDYCVFTGSGNMGVPYAIGSSNIPIQNSISGAAQAVGGAMEFGGGLGAIVGSFLGIGDIESGISAATSGVNNIAQGTMQTLTPVVQCTGSLGGSAAIGQSMDAKLTLLYFPPIDDAGFTAVYGHPVMRVATPVAGYCKTRGFSLQSGARGSEMIQISRMMDSGVFIE